MGQAMARDMVDAFGETRLIAVRLLPPTALIVAALVIATTAAEQALHAVNPAGAWTYNAGQNAISWFDTGFARRELAGTILRLLSLHPLIGTVWLWLGSMSALAAASAALCFRSSLRWGERLGLAATAFAVLLRLSFDVGRLDATIMVLGIGAAWAAREARWGLCATFLFVALLFHETGLIELLPLAVATAWASGAWRRWRTPNAIAGLTILVAGLALYILSFHPSVEVGAIGRRLHAEFPDPRYADQALFLNLAGGRALNFAQCLGRQVPIYRLEVVDGLLLCGIFAAGLQPTRWRLVLAATAGPLLALSTIAIDLGRWAVFGAFGAFTISALLAGSSPTKGGRWAAIGATLAACALMAWHPRPVGAGTAIPAVEDPVQEIWFPLAGALSFDGCDARWRDAIGVTAN
jgi:hypothetical protein